MSNSIRFMTAVAAAVALGIPVALDARQGYSQRPASPRLEILAVAPADLSQTRREFVRHGDGLFYVKATVNGHLIRFLVDTGASVVTLTASDAARAGVDADQAGYTAQVETASGSTAMAWAHLEHVEVAGQHVRGLRAAIMRHGLGISLLGQNILSRLGPVTIKGDRLRIG